MPISTSRSPIDTRMMGGATWGVGAGGALEARAGADGAMSAASLEFAVAVALAFAASSEPGCTVDPVDGAANSEAAGAGEMDVPLGPSVPEMYAARACVIGRESASPSRMTDETSRSLARVGR
jgi:hypothetical protein